MRLRVIVDVLPRHGYAPASVSLLAGYHKQLKLWVRLRSPPGWRAGRHYSLTGIWATSDSRTSTPSIWKWGMTNSSTL